MYRYRQIMKYLEISRRNITNPHLHTYTSYSTLSSRDLCLALHSRYDTYINISHLVYKPTTISIITFSHQNEVILTKIYLIQGFLIKSLTLTTNFKQCIHKTIILTLIFYKVVHLVDKNHYMTLYGL